MEKNKERYDRIVEHEVFGHYLQEINELEKDRIYCRHNLIHLLDVARIAYIINLEKEIGLSKDIIYGAALLHDIGKVEQYREKIPHEVTGAEKAVRILAECGYEESEIEMIKNAILDHRRGPKEEGRRLSEILYEADKKSRICLYCQAKTDCNWTEEAKNSRIDY